MSSDHITVLLRSREGEELHVQGRPELTGRFMRAFFQQEAGSEPAFELVSQEATGNTIRDLEVESTTADRRNGVPVSANPTLLQFYRSIDPASQVDQVLVITYYCQKYDGLESLSLDDYDKAYGLLQRIPVEKPGNMKSSVRNVVDRSKYLRNAERGLYTLTITGEEHVEQMIAEKTAPRE